MENYKHILVPLDGSELAELALDDAFSLAQSSQAESTLLQVVPSIEQVLGNAEYPVYVDEQWTTRRTLALQYLEKVSKRADGENLKVHLAVDIGPAAETIIDYAHEHPIDLIVMATHGRSGLQRWVYGSVADKVLRGAGRSILLVRAHLKREPARETAPLVTQPGKELTT